LRGVGRRFELPYQMDGKDGRCHIHAMADPTKLTLEDSLALSEGQAARGEAVPLEPVLQRLRASLARMETRSRHNPIGG
jgi:hypothetical protein